MTAQSVRRLYLYAAALLGLQLAASGAIGVMGVLLARVFAPDAVSGIGQAGLVYQLSLNLALLIVGLPLWLGHWIWAQRIQRHPDEQHSALRRLYGYAVLLIAMLNILFAIQQVLSALVGPHDPFLDIGQAAPTVGVLLAPALGALVVWAGVWRYHWRVFSNDRPVVETMGAPATLRRWYLVVVQVVSLVVASFAAVDLLHALLQAAVAPTIGRSGIIAALPSLVAGVLVWLPHHLWARMLILEPSPLRADEASSTLRQVAAAIVITAAAVAGLGGLTILLDAVLRAAFGATAWRVVIADHTQALAAIGITSALWWYYRQQLTNEARLSEVEARVDTARRTIGYLTAAVGLGALFFGLGGLISTLARLVVAPEILGLGWREALSWNLALSIVALPVYGFTARSTERVVAHAPVEERTLARRIYLYAALLFGIVAAIVAGVLLLQQLLSALLGAAESSVVVELGRWLGYTLVGAVIAIFYARLLRSSTAARAETGTGVTIGLLVDEPLHESLTATIVRELPGAVVEVVGKDGRTTSGAALTTADVLVVSLGMALNAPTAALLRGFPGRRLLLATSAPPYEVIGAHRDAAIVREAARVLRISVQSPPPASPVTPPTRSAQTRGAT